MSFHVLQKAPCSKACSNCPNARRVAANRDTSCDAQRACAGYGSTAACPPLIVLAVVECAMAALAAMKLPAFGSGLRSVRV